jgi:hypothetical protein
MNRKIAYLFFGLLPGHCCHSLLVERQVLPEPSVDVCLGLVGIAPYFAFFEGSVGVIIIFIV